MTTVITSAKCYYSLRVHYYKSLDKHFSVSVVSFKKNRFATITTDITEHKKAEALQEKLHEMQQYAENIVETMRQPLMVLDGDLHVFTANSAFCQYFQVNKEDTVGVFIYDLGNGQWNIPDLRKLLEEILPQNKSFENYRVEHDFESIGRKVILLNARELSHSDGKKRMIFLSFHVVTE